VPTKLRFFGISAFEITTSNGTTPYEAALTAEWLGLDYVIPTHFVTVDRDVEAFLRLMNNMASDPKPHTKAVLLKPGETFTYPEQESAETASPNLPLVVE